MDEDELFRWMSTMANRMGWELSKRDPGPCGNEHWEMGESRYECSLAVGHRGRHIADNGFDWDPNPGPLDAPQGLMYHHPAPFVVTDEYCDIDAGYCSTHDAWIDDHEWKLSPEQAQAGLEGFAKLAGIVPESAKLGVLGGFEDRVEAEGIK